MWYRIGETNYKLIPAIITLIRYRILFNRSFVSDFWSDSEEKQVKALERVVYAAIDGDRPEYGKYLYDIKDDHNFFSTALALQQKMFGDNSGIDAAPAAAQTQKQDDGNDDIQIMALAMLSGLPEWAYLEFSVFDAIRAVITINKMRYGTSETTGKKRVKYTPEQMAAIYGGKK